MHSSCSGPASQRMLLQSTLGLLRGLVAAQVRAPMSRTWHGSSSPHWSRLKNCLLEQWDWSHPLSNSPVCEGHRLCWNWDRAVLKCHQHTQGEAPPHPPTNLCQGWAHRRHYETWVVRPRPCSYSCCLSEKLHLAKNKYFVYTIITLSVLDLVDV